MGIRNALLQLAAAALLCMSAASAGANCFAPDVEASSLRFIATQRDEAFEGRFREFTGTLCLDPAAPASGQIELRVRTASVDSGLPEADTALRSALFLDSGTHPEAVFTGVAIRPLGGDRYEVTGTFSLREGAHTLTVPFAFRPLPEGNAWTLDGETSIRRLDYGVGIGEWLDTQFLADEVILKFAIRLAPAGSQAR
jgi:polyisoprenoid-binding protein YceI